VLVWCFPNSLQAGIEAAEASADLMKANMARKETAEEESVQHEEKRLATWGTDVPDDLVLDKKLAESLKKEDERRREEKDERKSKCNVKWNDEILIFLHHLLLVT